MPPSAIVGSLSNFDVVNDTGKPVHDLELDIRNITPNDILEWYAGANAWGDSAGDPPARTRCRRPR